MAVDLAERGWFIDIGLQPGDFDFNIETPTGDLTGSESTEHLHINLGWSRTFAAPGQRHGWLTDIGLTISQAELQGGEFTAYGVHAHLGYAYAFNPRWTGWAGLSAGGGFADLSLDNVGIGEFSADGFGYFAGPTAAVVWNVSSRWSIGAHLGWTAGRYELSGDPLDLTVETSGITGGIRISYRSSFIAGRLE